MFGLDEAFKFHEENLRLQTAYVLLGSALAASASFLAVRASEGNRVWYAYFASGLALFGIGSLVIEQVKQKAVCASLAVLGENGCLWRYHVEEPLEFLGAWLALVAVLGIFSERKPPRFSRLALLILPALWTIFIVYSYPFGSAKVPDWGKQAFAQFESGLYIHGYTIEANGKPTLIAHLPRGISPIGLGYSVHLLDQASGQPVAHVNKYLTMDLDYKITKLNKDHWPLFHQYSSLAAPPDFPSNRALSVAVSHWREQEEEFLPQRILSSDRQLLNDTQLILTEFVIPDSAAPATTSPLGVFDSGFELESADLPQSISLGEILSIAFSWRSAINGEEDLVQFLHFGHEESGEWWVYDQPPLGARLPTRLWYSGLADSEIWQVPVPADIEPGRYKVFTGLYRASDKERVAVTYADGRPWLDNRVALGDLLVE